jgi:deazaflavin-dependent oxidoreductase (nitroreductase family)
VRATSSRGGNPVVLGFGSRSNAPGKSVNVLERHTASCSCVYRCVTSNNAGGDGRRDAQPDTGADLAQSARSGIGPRWLMAGGRQAGKFLVNPLIVRTIGGRIGPYAVVRHVGRRSGRAYATPVWAASRGDDFVIALILGTEADWCRNIRSAGGCTLQVGGISHVLSGPQVVDQAAALPAFPFWIRLVARVVGIRYFLRLRAINQQALK